MKIKKGDNVIVISGQDRGKTGVVVKAFPREGKVLIEGVNMKKKHQRPGKNIQKGQVVEKPAPINASNVALVDPKTKKGTRVRFVFEKASPGSPIGLRPRDKKVRIAVKSGMKI